MAKRARIVDFEEVRSSSSSRTRKRPTDEKSSQGSKRAARTKSQPLDNKARTTSKTASQRSNTASKKSSSSRSRSNSRTSSRDNRNSSRNSSRSRSRNEQASKKKAAKRKNSAKLEQAKRERTKKKARKAFDRSVKQDAPTDDGSRPALYKGKMGSQHKKAARMQSGLPSFNLQLPNINVSRGKMTAIIVCACLVLTFAFLYIPVKNYYTAIRDQAKAEAAYEIVTTRNDALAEDVMLLSSQEGLEARVREQYGWVKQGENAVTVTGLSDSGQPSAAEILRTVTLNDLKAPETWYSPFFDKFFGYEN